MFFSSSTGIVAHHAIDIIENQTFNFASKTCTMQPVEEYLLETFPGSGRSDMLKVSMRKTLALQEKRNAGGDNPEFRIKSRFTEALKLLLYVPGQSSERIKGELTLFCLKTF